MWHDKIILIFGCLLHIQSSVSWMCSQNSDCESTVGAFCSNGICLCPAGQQLVLGGTICADSAPYLTSPCFEDHQCSWLITNFECRRSNITQEEGNCFCREGFHYLNGRCWQSVDYEAPCHTDEMCMGVLRDPFSLSCDQTTGTCQCAPGYYRRQRGECRKIANSVNEGCVLDEDCQFEHGACNINTFTCYDSSVAQAITQTKTENVSAIAIQDASIQYGGTKQLSTSSLDGVESRQNGVACDANNECNEPFICSDFGNCICPRGYYANNDGNLCYAELGSPSTEAQCVGLFAEVRDGICTCQANFYFQENMRDCLKVARSLTDSCISDDMCHTFGPAVRCLEGESPLFLRNCECIPELAVWDEVRSMCRLFVGIGEACQVNSDCLAGELEIECVVNSEGEGICTCPKNTTEIEGLCLTSGLQLGDSCQATIECTETANTECNAGRCSCAVGYREVDDGYCAPTIGGTCLEDSDCLIENTLCVTNIQTNISTCQCEDAFVAYDDECWPRLSSKDATCHVTMQCVDMLGTQSTCQNSTCVCNDGHHYRDTGCWPQIDLFEVCSRTSECYLAEMSERVVCRNSLCQCSFDYPYSAELNICSSATATMASYFTILAALCYILTPVLN